MPGAVEPGQARRILIIANPTAGGFNARTLEEIAEKLRTGGHHVHIQLTRRAGEIGATCAGPTLKADVVVIAGGDGSINEAITGFGERADPPALAVVPFGTANVLAQELKLPFKPARIAEMILADRRKPLHYGLANGHPFVLMASAGVDAQVVHAIPLDLKRRFGKLAYVLTALKIAFSGRKGSDIEVLTQGETIRCRLAVITNGKCYGGPFVICPEAAVTEPGLHLVALRRDDIAASLWAGIALALGRIHKARNVITRPVSHAEIRSSAPVAAQIDGDPFGMTPLVVEAVQNTVPIIVPRP
ncbi:diacylglycerol/lipid kinase family protein [Stappia sediminis]|uniref:diacylglycerol/lipid kinase family protein n=1 Tax=Stappia sediminis TaxID=2692190 RepID=UPI001AD8CE5B|nr:YegS/Rv2252/BmrU family lipid kinase [Stappia sediminis]